MLALYRPWNCATLDVGTGKRTALHEIDNCLRSGILDEAQCGVFQENKC